MVENTYSGTSPVNTGQYSFSQAANAVLNTQAMLRGHGFENGHASIGSYLNITGELVFPDKSYTTQDCYQVNTVDRLLRQISEEGAKIKSGAFDPSIDVRFYKSDFHINLSIEDNTFSVDGIVASFFKMITPKFKVTKPYVVNYTVDCDKSGREDEFHTYLNCVQSGLQNTNPLAEEVSDSKIARVVLSKRPQSQLPKPSKVNIPSVEEMKNGAKPSRKDLGWFG